MLQNAILECDSQVLGRAIDALNITDTILKVYDRIEQNNVKPVEVSSNHNSQLSSLFTTSSTTEGVFTRDGLLMQQESIVPSLTAFCVSELKRRNQKLGSQPAANLTDLENFLTNLQKHENHLVALHVLYRSWGHGALKNQVRIHYCHVSDYDQKLTRFVVDVVM